MSESAPAIAFAGKSMSPLIREGDQLLFAAFTQPAEISAQDIGDIVLVRDHSEWVAHRVILYQGKKVVKGDGAFGLQAAPAQVWGRIVGIERAGFSYSWGGGGHYGKHFFAKLSARHLSPRTKRLARAILKISTWLLFAAPKLFRIKVIAAKPSRLHPPN